MKSFCHLDFVYFLLIEIVICLGCVSFGFDYFDTVVTHAQLRQPCYYNRYQPQKDLYLILSLQVTTLDPAIEVLDSRIQFAQ